MRVAGHQPRERRLARAGRADDGGQRAGACRDRNVVQQCLVVLDRPRHAVHFESAGAGRRLGLGAPHQCAAAEHQVDVADRDGVAVVQHRRIDTCTVDECAVDAAVVADLRAARAGQQGRVVTGRQHVGDHDVVVGGAADLDRARRHVGGSPRPQDLQHARREIALARARRGRRTQRGDRFQTRGGDRLRHRGRPDRLGCARGMGRGAARIGLRPRRVSRLLAGVGQAVLGRDPSGTDVVCGGVPADP